jgi:hypothetical protein
MNLEFGFRLAQWWLRRRTFPKTTADNTNSPGVRDNSGDHGRGGLGDKVKAFLQMHPEKSDVDVAVAFKWKVSQIDVMRIRQSLPTRENPGNAEDALERS